MKHLLIPSAALILFSCTKPKLVIIVEPKTVTKNITFNVAPAKDYSASNFDNSTASVELIIMDYDAVSNNRILYDTVFTARKLSLYNGAPFPFRYLKSVDMIDADKKLKAAFIVHYETLIGGMTNPTTFGSSIIIDPGKVSKTIDVGI